MANNEPSPEQIDQLTSFLPAFEMHGREFGHWDISDPNSEVMHFPYAIYDEDVDQFFKLASQPCFADLHYTEKSPGEWIKSAGFYKNATLDQLCSLLTWWVRGERFSEGLWFTALKDGHIQNLLRRMQEIRHTMK